VPGNPSVVLRRGVPLAVTIKKMEMTFWGSLPDNQCGARRRTPGPGFQCWVWLCRAFRNDARRDPELGIPRGRSGLNFLIPYTFYCSRGVSFPTGVQIAEKIYAGGLSNYTAQNGLCRIRMGWGRTPRSSNPGTVQSASRAAQSNEQLANEKASANCCGRSPRKFDSLREQKILPLARVARVGFDSGPAL
jgi:hypothetical protein